MYSSRQMQKRRREKAPLRKANCRAVECLSSPSPVKLLSFLIVSRKEGYNAVLTHHMIEIEAGLFYMKERIIRENKFFFSSFSF